MSKHDRAPAPPPTVDRSLAEVVKADLRRRHAARLVTVDGLDLDDAGVMDGAWR